MFQKRTFVSVGLLVVMGGLAGWLLTRPDPAVRRDGAAAGPAWPFSRPTATAKKAAPPDGSDKDKAGAPAPTKAAPTGPAADVDELEITEPGKPQVLLKKESGDWRLVQPVSDRADRKAVEAALLALEDLKFKDVVAESTASYDKVQVKDDQVVKVVPKKDGKALATLLVGRGTNVRLGDDARVWSTSDLRRYALVREAKMWRDREVVRFDKDQLERIEVAFAGGARLAVRREAPVAPDDKSGSKPAGGPDKWALVEGGDLVGGPLDDTVPAAIVSSMTRLDAADFADGVSPQAAGLEPPRAAVSAVLTDGTKKTVLVGREEGQDVFVTTPGVTKVWKVRKFTADALAKPLAQWRDKTLTRIEAKDLAKIEIVKGSERTVLDRVDEKTWKATAPAHLAELDQGKAQILAGAFQHLRATSIVEAPGKDAGLAKPTGTVTLWKSDGSKTALVIGALADKTYHVKVSGRAEIFGLADYGVNRFLKAPADLKPTAPGAPPAHGM